MSEDNRFLETISAVDERPMTNRPEDPSLSLEAITTTCEYPPHYVEHVADLVGEDYAIKTFITHQRFEERFKRLGISPLQLASISRHLLQSLDFEQGLAAVAQSGYDEPVPPEAYQHQLQEEYQISQLSTLCNEFPHAEHQIPHVIGFLNGHARHAISFYFNNEGFMTEQGISLPAFAYLVSQLHGELEDRLAFAPGILQIAKEDHHPDARLDHLIRTYNRYADLAQPPTHAHPNSPPISPHTNKLGKSRKNHPSNAEDRYNPERLYHQRFLSDHA